MKTTVMFVNDSEPLGEVPIRIEGSGAEYRTDPEGKIELDLDLGSHTFEIQLGTDWISRTVSRQGHSPLFVVNISRNHTSGITTLNTLQVDLASLVGDRYVFETVLGRGGMGVVVKSIDRMLNRAVAIKMLSEELQDNEEANQIFLVEARNLATLSHPNLVAIHDILNVDGRVLMIFEYVLGENVEKLIKQRGRLDQKTVLRIAIQLTRCVAYLHEHELIHRDLKPANVIMQADGTLKLIDFGLARSLNQLYIRGTRVRGTPAYMAPEQIQGIHLTTATDLYQIGISMYEMLAGKLPFGSGDMAYAHVHVAPPPLTDKVPDIDPELAAIVHKCLEKQPKSRPSSADELLEMLQAVHARVVNRESQPGVGSSGEFDVRRSTGQFSSPSSAEISQFDAEQRSSGLGVMVGVGVLALIIAAVLIGTVISGDDDPATAEASTTSSVDPPVADPPEPIEPVEPVAELAPTEQAVNAARGMLVLGIATASGLAQGTASVRPEPEPTPMLDRPKARTTKPTARPKQQPKAAATKVETQPKETTKTNPKKANTGLLSVDEGPKPTESGNGALLPVN